jgi:uncharacterized integral membrane protein (TIGR00698 family)
MSKNAKTSQQSDRKKWLGLGTGLLVIVLLSVAAWWVTKKVYSATLPFGIPGKVLEFPIWAVLFGLLGNAVLKILNLKEFVRPGVRTEFFLKIGLVLLGAGINLSLMVTAAGGAILQAVIMITSVFFFTWWLAKKFGLDDKLRAVMATALSVCGVSAAIAAAGAVLAKKEQVTYVITLVILVALPMMVLSPLAASAMGLPDAVAGAWFGGNIDTTAAVVGAGTIYSEQAQQVAAIVKSTQNVLIGVAAFFLAVYFSARSGGTGQRPSARMIWERFPKFVLGFVAASILYTLGWIDGSKGSVLEALKNWAFTLAFVSMGLEFSVRELKSMGWRPAAVFLIATLFSTLLALGVAWVIFQYLLPIQLP